MKIKILKIKFFVLKISKFSYPQFQKTFLPILITLYDVL